MNQKKFERLMKEILKFCDKCDWAQFHDPKNLGKSLMKKAMVKDQLLISSIN